MNIDRLTRLQQLLAASPKDPFLLFAVAKEYEKVRDAPKALEHYDLLENTDSQYVGLYYHKGKLLEALEQTDAAMNTYQKGIAIAMAANDRHTAAELRGALDELLM
jgi:tetratricopeptide (TPR) repeat protein